MLGRHAAAVRYDPKGSLELFCHTIQGVIFESDVGPRIRGQPRRPGVGYDIVPCDAVDRFETRTAPHEFLIRVLAQHDAGKARNVLDPALFDEPVSGAAL